jgi:glycosyl hydrolase family 1
LKRSALAKALGWSWLFPPHKWHFQCAGGRADRSGYLQCVQSLWKAEQIHITENGCAAEDLVAEDGAIYDTDRIMFLRNNLTQLQRAVADGVPVKGYFQWSLMVNFEWTGRRLKNSLQEQQLRFKRSIV